MNPIRLHAALQLIFPPFFLVVTRGEREAAGGIGSFVFVALLAAWMVGVWAGLVAPRWRPGLWLMLAGALGPVTALGLHCLGVLLGFSELRSHLSRPDLILAVFVPIIILLPGLVFAAVNAYYLYLRQRALPVPGL